MLRTFTCIMCPQGCEITVDGEKDKLTVCGNKCPKGKEYAINEVTNPMRNIATSILIKNGRLPLASVRLTKPIPKSKIFEAIEEIHKVCLEAPVYEGDVIIHKIIGLESDVIITKTVGRKE